MTDNSFFNKVSDSIKYELSKRKIIKVEISARHVHLSQSDLEILFGKGYSLTPKRDLSQPGQYLSEERVKLVGAKSEMNNIAILGPVRKNTQVELSISDARALGIKNITINESGQLEGAGDITIIGKNGSIEAKNSVIVAKRHIHLREKDALEWNLYNGQIVKVKVYGIRSLIFDEVVVRVSDKFMPAMHIDFDEANACGLLSQGYGEIIL
ncbi:phosphate propanoyltransferase [Brachyspira innocens]|uniref:phosphate propanoyltransferase n=1 Tax=Brachyspira innocens TaxID=13264 RepID=UPI0026EB2E8B|nr:phosphate propanoyltransferase [Brachyspira innocens]